MDHQHETEDPLGPLDFTPTCSVGHPGGSTTDTTGAPYPPCQQPARFVTDIHDHPKDKTHFWCVKHLTVHTLWIQQFAAANDRVVCLECGHQIRGVEDLIYNLLVIGIPGTSDTF